MIKLLRSVVVDLLWNEQKARIWLRGALLWAATAAAQVVAYPPEVVSTWGLKDWASRFAIAGAAGFAGLLAAGQRNPTPEQMADSVEAVRMRRGEAPPPAEGPPAS